MKTIPCALFLLAFLPASCRSSGVEVSAAPAGSAGKLGVLAPFEPATLALWPEVHSGAWTVLEVLPHGAPVKKSDVLVRCDTRAIDEELHRAELELATAEIAHRGLFERGELEDEGARTALERARAGLARARRSLDGWKQKELAFASRADGLARRWEEANLEDQADELGQLEKMYAADELVDATEDIVLKRSRRTLSLTQDQNTLARDRAGYRTELELALQTEQREEEFRAQGESVARLERQQAIEARARADAAVRSTEALTEQRERVERLRRDRARFELRAPSDGVLLHGAVEDHRPGKTPARYQRGSTLAPRAVLFLIAPPDPAAVAFDVSEAELGAYQDGTRVEVQALAADGRTGGTVALDEHARSLGVGEATFEASARLDPPLAGARYGQRVRIVPGAKP